jgi:hypothetical protein
VYNIYFWMSYYRPWFLWPETKKLVIPFFRIYLIASLLSVHCVSPHRRSHKPRRISTLKTKYHLLWLPPLPQPIVENGSSIQGRLQDGVKIEDFKYLSSGKIFPVPTLSLSPLCLTWVGALAGFVGRRGCGVGRPTGEWGGGWVG